MPDEQQQAERNFAQGFGRRAMVGNCADCASVLLDVLALVCDDCRNKPENQTPAFAEHEAGHRERLHQYLQRGG